ncbi:hypothetical protein NL676_027611 [Syzygium grande]|nr:hypothetical protein NL676_027611 [Syzygium grande]
MERISSVWFRKIVAFPRKTKRVAILRAQLQRNIHLKIKRRSNARRKCLSLPSPSVSLCLSLKHRPRHNIAVHLSPVRFREVMLEKQLTGHRVDRSICDWYWDHAISQGDQLQPVIASPTHYLFQIVREAITFLACSQVEMPPLMGIEFLCRAVDVLADYLGGLNEDVIKDNFVIVYES